jgi:hypothetical protein
MAEKKINDATAAETVVKSHMETKYAKNLKSVYFRKSWYSVAGTQEFYDVEGTGTYKKGMMGSEMRNFRYQIDPYTGNVMGYEEIVVPK